MLELRGSDPVDRTDCDHGCCIVSTATSYDTVCGEVRESGKVPLASGVYDKDGRFRCADSGRHISIFDVFRLFRGEIVGRPAARAAHWENVARDGEPVLEIGGAALTAPLSEKSKPIWCLSD